MAQPALDISHLRYRHGDGRQLEMAVSLKVMPGQAVAITGPTGSGKTTLLRALAGNPPEGATVAWDAAILPERPALFLQDPEAQLLCSRVEEEVELGPRNQGLTGQPLAQRIDDALEALDINALRDCDIQTLSMGQKHRVALSALLAMHPGMLLLDEPFSQLDASGEARLRALLTALKAKGHAIGITAHTVCRPARRSDPRRYPLS
jgi:energy-coupling factor transporter ATP-binding protein EcfA2